MDDEKLNEQTAPPPRYRLAPRAESDARRRRGPGRPRHGGPVRPGRHPVSRRSPRQGQAQRVRAVVARGRVLRVHGLASGGLLRRRRDATRGATERGVPAPVGDVRARRAREEAEAQAIEGASRDR